MSIFLELRNDWNSNFLFISWFSSSIIGSPFFLFLCIFQFYIFHVQDSKWYWVVAFHLFFISVHWHRCHIENMKQFSWIKLSMMSCIACIKFMTCHFVAISHYIWTILCYRFIGLEIFFVRIRFLLASSAFSSSSSSFSTSSSSAFTTIVRRSFSFTQMLAKNDFIYVHPYFNNYVFIRHFFLQFILTVDTHANIKNELSPQKPIN